METKRNTASQVSAVPQTQQPIAGQLTNTGTSTQVNETVYRIGTATVLPMQNRIVMTDHSIVEIRPKSFDVLLYLCQHSGRLVEKESLVQAIWKDVCVTDDSLVQCIVDVRKALGPQNSKHLRTITRRGYMLNAQAIDQDQHCSSTSTPTVVISPFQCASNPHDMQIAGGLCDGVIARLLKSKTPALQVQTSDENREANYQIKGNLQFLGDRTRVTVQLLNLLSGQYIWANIYEKITEDPFLLQDNLSHDIATDLLSRIADQHTIELSG